VGGTCGCVREKRVCTGFWLENQKERRCFEDHDVDGRIILCGLDSSGSG
jgi:hypothetical protein